MNLPGARCPGARRPGVAQTPSVSLSSRYLAPASPARAANGRWEAAPSQAISAPKSLPERGGKTGRGLGSEGGEDGGGAARVTSRVGL